LIAIINTWSDIQPPATRISAYARRKSSAALWQAGGFPIEMTAIALAEPFQETFHQMYRNFLAMETEELLRSYPADGCVLMGGCDRPRLPRDGRALDGTAGRSTSRRGRCCAATGTGRCWSGQHSRKYWRSCVHERYGETTGRIEEGIARSPALHDVARHRPDLGAEALGSRCRAQRRSPRPTPTTRRWPLATGKRRGRDGVGGRHAEKSPHTIVLRQRGDLRASPAAGRTTPPFT